MACLPSGLESLRDAVPSSRNLVVSYLYDTKAYFCEVESGMVVRSNDRIVKPRSSLVLIDQNGPSLLGRTKSCRHRMSSGHDRSHPHHRQ